MAEMVLDGVTKRFGETVAVSNLSLAMADGEFVVLLGPTGAGKTTTLRLVAGLERPDAGRVLIGGRDVTCEAPPMRNTAFVFQQYSLYPHLTAYENLAFPLRSPARRVPADEIDRRIREVAGKLRIDHKLANKATKLSGGEMQRVAIGRALVREPELFLMDEPLSSLDAKLRAELRLELKRIQQELGATILYVTHDQIEAMTMADRIGVVQDGVLVHLGTPREVYERPRNTYVAARLGAPAINLLPVDLLPATGQPAAARTIGARTEHIVIGPPGEGLPLADVSWIEHLGDQNHLHLKLGEREIVTLADPATSLAVGDSVSLRLQYPIFFDGAGERIDNGEKARTP